MVTALGPDVDVLGKGGAEGFWALGGDEPERVRLTSGLVAGEHDSLASICSDTYAIRNQAGSIHTALEYFIHLSST